MGFWRNYDGTISISGQDILKMNEEDLSDLVSIVQQDVFLFNMSIEENIRLGKENASRDEIIEAAKKAQIHDMILSLPAGYQTVVGEAGAKLSGGEKQRISIARMILKDAPIVILDEATAAIDPYNEYLIQDAISNLAEGKTIIMIVHNLNTVRNVDQIILMENGKILAKGRHEELLQTSKMYQNMLNAQNDVDNWNIKEVSDR